MAEAAHQGGAKVVVQINHAGGAARPELNDGAEPWAPASVPMGPDRPLAHAMSDAEIREMVRAYGLAARRLKAVGFDGVQLHGAHGYLISQFISPFTNQRSDRWGGSFDNRLNFLRAVCDEVRGQIGADFPLMIELASQDFVDGGLTPQDGARIAGRLADFGLDAVEVSGGVQVGRNQANNVRLNVKERADEAYFLDNARRIRDATDLPVMIVGGFRTPELMQRMIENEGMDFVALCRPLVHDPEFPNRMAAGSDERSGCISCNLCLTNRHAPLRCWYKYPDRIARVAGFPILNSSAEREPILGWTVASLGGDWLRPIPVSPGSTSSVQIVSIRAAGGARFSRSGTSRIISYAPRDAVRSDRLRMLSSPHYIEDDENHCYDDRDQPADRHPAGHRRSHRSR